MIFSLLVQVASAAIFSFGDNCIANNTQYDVTLVPCKSKEVEFIQLADVEGGVQLKSETTGNCIHFNDDRGYFYWMECDDDEFGTYHVKEIVPGQVQVSLTYYDYEICMGYDTLGNGALDMEECDPSRVVTLL